MKFLDRIEESRRLSQFLASAQGGLACIYGRRLFVADSAPADALDVSWAMA